jgi:hypothetical protein
LTNDFQLPALTVAQIYKARWQIEIYHLDCCSGTELYVEPLAT